MKPENAHTIDAVLGALPLDDRLVALVCTILQRRPEAVPAVISMIAATTALTRGLSLRNRIVLAELLRDSADEIENARMFERV